MSTSGATEHLSLPRILSEGDPTEGLNVMKFAVLQMIGVMRSRQKTANIARRRGVCYMARTNS